MKSVRWLPLLAAAGLLLLTPPLLAHHGAADYDHDQLLTIKGTVVDYELINPHTVIVVRGGPEGKDPTEWRVESVR